jgi:hypothetical protein
MSVGSWFKAHEERQKEFERAADPSCSLYPALCNPATFPSFADLTELDDPSTNYYTGWDEGLLVRSREWALLGEVTELQHFLRARFLLQTRLKENLALAFYPESLPLPGFDVTSVKVGHTFALLNAERKNFMDMTSGVRMENLNTCWTFKASLGDVIDEADKLLAAADAKEKHEQNRCFTCANPSTSRCAKCMLACFCSRECQVTAWPKHKKLCKDSSKLLSLACLLRHPFVHQEGHYLSWNNIPGYTPLPIAMEPPMPGQEEEKANSEPY